MKQAESLKTIVYNAVLKGIIQDEYKPGEILNEKQLVEKYEVSKSPVREALLSLCNEGVLRNIPRYGYEVVRLTKEDISNILRFRLILESGCLGELPAHRPRAAETLRGAELPLLRPAVRRRHVDPLEAQSGLPHAAYLLCQQPLRLPAAVPLHGYLKPGLRPVLLG